MTDEISLERGLLGYWPGERSPDGIVRDHSPEGNDGTYGIDARWIWFTDPRAIRHVGSRDRTYFAYLGGPTGTDIVAAAYDHDERDLSRSVVEPEFSTDDHTNPSLFVRDDGHVLVFWAGHNGEEIFSAVSTDPESVDDFADLSSFAGESVTYPNPVRSPNGDGIYLFYRDRVVTRDTTDDRWGYMGDGNLYYRESSDGGETWTEETLLARPPEGHYSMYFVPAVGDDAVHLFFTDAERGGDAPKWNVMYAKFRDGSFYTATDERIADPDGFPLEKAEMETVYDSTAEGNSHAWVWDAAVDDGGRPVVAYATFPSTLNHEYRWARHDGEVWRDCHLANAGRYIARRPIELHYSGGLAIDRDDPTTVYGCVSRGEDCLLRRYETETGGRTWSETTVTRRPLGVDNRPVVPHNASDDLPVLWLTGSYKHMDTAATVLRGLPGEDLAGDVLEGDSTRGVDLGLDLYGPEAFTRGLTLTATVTPDDPADPGVVANLGGAVVLGTAVGNGSGIGCEFETTGAGTSLATDRIDAGHPVHAAVRWDGNAAELLVDGELRDDATATGSLAIDDEWASWTLLKDEYLIGRGFAGRVADLRLYRRALNDAELAVLADVE